MSYGENILKRYLEIILPFPVLLNHRPHWLYGLELDFYFPGLFLGIELQGDHHYKQTKYSFDPKCVQARDAAKRSYCDDRGVFLITVDPGKLNFSTLFRKLRKFCKSSQRDLISKHAAVIEKLTHESKLYRLTLKTNFNSVASSRRNRFRHGL